MSSCKLILTWPKLWCHWQLKVLKLKLKLKLMSVWFGFAERTLLSIECCHISWNTLWLATCNMQRATSDVGRYLNDVINTAKRGLLKAFRVAHYAAANGQNFTVASTCFLLINVKSRATGSGHFVSYTHTDTNSHTNKWNLNPEVYCCNNGARLQRKPRRCRRCRCRCRCRRRRL